jgi:hypothetical protein
VVVAQLSLPYRIALVAMLAACAVWFTVLKPKDPGAEPATTAPGATGLANDVSAAKGAVAASESSAAATRRATGAAKPAAAADAHAAAKANAAAKATDEGTTKASKAHDARAAAARADRSAPLLSALDRDRAVVLLFFSERGIEDRAVRRAVTAVGRHHGRVVVKAAPISQVGRYQAITRGAQVLQAPTTLVIAPGRSAKAVVGYTTTAELDQAVGDALAAKRSEK